MEELLVDLVTKYPLAATIVGVIGVLRLVFKPVMSAARSIVEATPSQKDNEFLDKLEASKIYKAVAYVVDWFASIKLPGQK